MAVRVSIMGVLQLLYSFEGVQWDDNYNLLI